VRFRSPQIFQGGTKAKEEGRTIRLLKPARWIIAARLNIMTKDRAIGNFDLRRCTVAQKNKIKISAVAVGAIAAGSFAVGALAIGALAIGTLVVRRLAIHRGSLGSLEIGELRVGRLKVKELQVEDNVQLPPERRFDLQERV
jgi:hypothetical protein